MRARVPRFLRLLSADPTFPPPLRSSARARVMTSSYAHVLDRPAAAGAAGRLEPLTANLETLTAKKNFSVSHLLDLEEAAEMAGGAAEDGGAEAGRGLLESPGLTSGSDTAQQDSKCPARTRTHARACVRGDEMISRRFF